MNKTVNRVKESTIRIDIYMAGDIEKAKQICRQYCYDEGFCVHIEKVDYIYTGGEEAGFKVGIINYPRFPETEDYLWFRAKNLGEQLMLNLCQNSFSIVGPDRTEWYTTKPLI